MSASGVAGYAAINSQVRAMVSTMLSPEIWEKLCNSADFPQLISILKETVYAEYFNVLEDKELTSRRAVFEIKKHLAQAFSTITHLIPNDVRPVIKQLYRLYEVDNLKAVLRGLMIGESWQKVRFTLFPLGEIMSFPAQAMTESKSMESAIEFLRGTSYFATLSHAMERFNSEQSLFPLEVALDLDYWRELWKDCKRLDINNQKQVMRLVGSVLDKNNLTWAIRYRLYHNLSEEEIINYTLPFGYRVKDEHIRIIAAGGDAAHIISSVYPELENSSILSGKLGKKLPEVELELQRFTLKHCQEAFSGYPFHAGIPVAYLMLIEMEIQDLTVLMEAKSMKIPPERFLPYLLFSSRSAEMLRN